MTTTQPPRSPNAPAPGRGRSRRRPLRTAVTLVTVAAVGVGAVVVALNRLDDATPVAERCAATADGRTWYLSVTQADNAALITGATVRRGRPGRAGARGGGPALQAGWRRDGR